MKDFYKSLLLLLLPIIANAQTPGEFILRSVLINPPQQVNGYQYVEIAGPETLPLSNIWFIEIDGHAGSTGKIDIAINLSAYSTGGNGLLLIRDAATVLKPPPDAPTQVVVHDFNPDLSNQSATFALVTNFTGAVGDDVDNNNDGVLNKNVPWGTVITAVGISDGSAGNFSYGQALSPYFGTNIPAYGNQGYDGFVQFNNQYYGFDINPQSPAGGIYQIDSAWDTYDRENTFIEAGKTLSPGRTDAALPVNLLSFNASLENEDVFLNWSSAAVNMNEYTIERSADAVNFSLLTSIAAKTNAGIQQYSYTDYAAKNPVLFYRLKMTDKSGIISYSPVLKINISSGTALSAYPNPVEKNIIITHKNAQSGAVVRILSLNGNLLQLIPAQLNTTQTSIDVSKYVQGTYLIQFINASNKESLLFIKK